MIEANDGHIPKLKVLIKKIFFSVQEIVSQSSARTHVHYSSLRAHVPHEKKNTESHTLCLKHLFASSASLYCLCSWNDLKLYVYWSQLKNIYFQNVFSQYLWNLISHYFQFRSTKPPNACHNCDWGWFFFFVCFVSLYIFCVLWLHSESMFFDMLNSMFY